MHNIAIVANTSFNIVNFRLPLMQHLKNIGYRVIAIAPEDEHTPTIHIHNFEYIPLTKLARKGTNPFQDLKLLVELKNIYKKENITIALQFTIKPNIYGSLAAVLSNTKTICTVTGLGYTFLNNSLASTISKFLYKIAFHYAQLIYFQNTDDENLFIQKNIAQPNKTKVINGSGIDTAHFHPNYCKKNPTEKNTLTFLFIGRLLKDKGILEFLKAAQKITAKHNNTYFAIVGECDTNNPSAISQATLHNYLLENRITYLGYQKDTRNAICQADCLVLPSYREGLPRVILEAMAMQKPCITTNTAGCKDAVDKTCAILANVADTESLALAIEKFITLTTPQKEEMGVAARNRAIQKFSIEIINQKYQADIAKIISTI